MNNQRKLILALAVLILSIAIILAYLYGKQDSPVTDPGPLPPAPPPPPTTSVAVTDPAELEKIWQEYMYDAITTVCNSRNFNGAEEIDPLNIVEFCWFRYIDEHGRESLPLADDEGFSRLLPLDTVLQYAQRYFNLDNLDVSRISDLYYDPEKRGFKLRISNDPHPSHTDSNAFGIQLDKVLRNSDGTLTVTMVRYHSRETGLAELVMTYTLKEREDGSLYFLNGRWDFIDNDLVNISGEHLSFDKITGFAEDIYELSMVGMVGEVDGRLLLAYTPFKQGSQPSLMLVNAVTLTVEKRIGLSETIEYHSEVKLTADKIIVRLKDRVLTFNHRLEPLGEVLLPREIAEKVDRKPQYDAMGMPDVIFGGYDISDDLTKVAYVDEIGLKLYDLTTQGEVLLSSTKPIEGGKLIDKSYHRAPRFVADNTKVITAMIGYECILGYTLCDLEKGSARFIQMITDGPSTAEIRYDTGLLWVNQYVQDQENQTSATKTFYLNFFTEEIKEVPEVDPGETGDIRMPQSGYIGRNYAAFATWQWDGGDSSNSRHYINRLDLKTLTVEPKVLTVKGTEPNILGVLDDGRVLFWYSLNPSEAAICITKFS